MQVHEDIEVSFKVKDGSGVSDDIENLYEDNPEVLNEINYQLGVLIKMAVQDKASFKLFMKLHEDLASKMWCRHS